jgi:undecaprenyldiphospho-muramoylpentapeptide beta-N-acetylglucosaminyltransferase
MKVLIAGGGTGGHLFPGIALAEELITRAPNRHEVLFVGTARGIEAKVVPQSGFRLELIDVAGLKGVGLKRLARGLLRLPGALWRSVGILRQFRPDVVVGVGGYASGPVALAAWLMGIPVAVQEQNALPGFTNRVLGRLAQVVFTAFPGAGAGFAQHKVQMLGNPIRRALMDNFLKSTVPHERFKLLVFGGSQGARALNRAMVEAVGYLADIYEKLYILHQTGPLEVQKVREGYARAGASAEVVDFITDMSSAYARADAVVCRAGADLGAVRAGRGQSPGAKCTGAGRARGRHPGPRAGPYRRAAGARDQGADGPRAAASNGARSRVARPSRGRPRNRQCPGRAVGASPQGRGEAPVISWRDRKARVHFVGIGGIGMSGIAEVLLNLGYQVSGSDRRLSALGAQVHIGPHQAANVGDCDVVVVSSAVRRDNPEVRAARERKIPVSPRAEMLAELMRLKFGVAVAGSHGKTTITSMIATVLAAGGLDPTAVVGGKLNSLGSNAKLGRGEVMVVEADESDGSFLRLSPAVVVVTNIDPEHLDHFGTLESLKEAFVRFASSVPFYGVAVMCLDHPHVQSLLPLVEKRVITYGFSAQADYCAQDVRLNGFSTSFRAVRRGEDLGELTLGMVGRQCAERAGGVGGRRGDASAVRGGARGPGIFWRSAAPLHRARRGAGRHRRR